MATHHERRVTIPSTLWDSLGYYVSDERLKVSEEIRDSITIESVIAGILKKKMIESGHYPPKEKVPSISRPTPIFGQIK